jgi:hypothetical protein
VQTSFTTASPSPRTLPVSNDVQAIAVRSGTDIKYAGTPVGLSRIIDGLTDAEPDDFVSIILTGDVRAIAIDDNGNTLVQDDIVWVGFADGTLFRSLLASEGGPADGDPLVPGDFKSYSLAGSPVITSLSVDKLGRLWIGTETRGVQVFDLGETLTPAQPNLRDPFDFNNDGDTVPQEYLDTGRGLTSNNVTGIAFQATVDPDAVAWMSHLRDLNIVPGGVSRFDANAANDNVTIVDERVTVFRPEAGVLPEDQTNGPASTWVNTAAADSAGNVWFGTTEQDPQGVSRFGNAGVISLDSSNYVNVSVIATVTLQDDGLNTVPTLSDLAIVRVTSTSDGTGFFMILAETGPDTGVFSGQFGFTNGDRRGRMLYRNCGLRVGHGPASANLPSFPGRVSPDEQSGKGFRLRILPVEPALSRGDFRQPGFTEPHAISPCPGIPFFRFRCSHGKYGKGYGFSHRFFHCGNYFPPFGPQKEETS